MPVCRKRRSEKARICIGDLDRRVDIVSRETGSPDYGSFEPDMAFTLVATVWASIDTVRGQQNLAHVNIEDKPTHIIRMRYRDLDSTSWLRYGGEYYKPLFNENAGERNDVMEIVCCKTGNTSQSGAVY